MPETTSNIEFAQKLHESSHHGGGPHGKAWIEVAEAFVLAAVAVLTAWSGYQAARWDGRSSASYALASATTIEAQEQQTLAGQEHIYDVTTFNSWIEASLRGEHAIAAEFERRFRPEYAAAYGDWLKTDPLHNPKAPAGPSFMPEYRNARLQKARLLASEAHRRYLSGVAERATGDEYVRITVVLATVLLLTALSQRFKIHAARVGLVVVAAALLMIAMSWIATFPRA
jgi:hypothetical protein